MNTREKFTILTNMVSFLGVLALPVVPEFGIALLSSGMLAFSALIAYEKLTAN